MDIYCSICAEPWELDTLHDETTHRNPHKPWMLDHKTDGYYEGNGFWHSQSEYEKYFYAVMREFRSKGCEAITMYNGHHNEETINPKNRLYGDLMDFAGDDIDFAVSMMDEAQSFGLFDEE